MTLLSGSNLGERALRTMRCEGLPALVWKTAKYLREERELDRIVRADAARLVRKLTSHGAARRGLFIDCGSNLGQGFSYFKRRYHLTHFDFVLIEPNPYCMPALTAAVDHDSRIRLVEAAGGTHAGSAVLFGTSSRSQGNTSDGASVVSALLPDEESSFGPAIEVKTFSLADFVLQEARSYPSIAMKLDIEGAEYDVLEDMLEKQALEAIDVLYVEFHSRHMHGDARARYRTRELDIVGSFGRRGTNYRLWR